jgi:thiamine-phosphate pyrophosphorylase
VFDLSTRHLYLCVPHREDMATFLPAVLRGGVDVVQLREKERGNETIRATGRVMAAICRDHGVPFIVNDSPELTLEVGADGVHVGQDDVSVDHCRGVLGADAVVGLSTHSSAEFDGALSQSASYFSAGPIVPTPTKLGRPGTGIDYAVSCQARCDRPVFVTGGVNEDNIAQLVTAGLRHFVVVRAICDAPDPELAARTLRRALDVALENA